MSARVKALFEFWGESEAELSFQVGDIISVIKKDDAGWWEGELNGRKGLFPSNYVEPVVVAAPPPSRPMPPVAINSKPPPNPIATAGRAGPPPVKIVPPPPTASAASPSAAISSPSGITRSPPPPKPAEAAVKVTSSPGGGQPLPENAPKTFDPKAASSSGAGERKAAGRVQGGGGDAPEKKVIRVSKTKFGLWSSNMAFYTGIIMMPMGLLSILWNQVDVPNKSFQYVITGTYSFVIGLSIVWYESRWGTHRGESRFPLRGLVYFGLAIFMFFSLSTVFCGVFLLMVSILNCISVLMKEVYDTPADTSHKSGGSDLVKHSSFCEGLFAWLTMIKQQNKTGALVFMTIYFLGNVALFATTVNYWVEKIASLPAPNRLSDWAPWAKGFGSLLDLNCAIIVLPVSRTLLRMLYNRSTADQGCFSRTLRAILAFVPLDQNITFHKMIAQVILFSAIGHITIHHINLAFAYHNTLELFGTSAWVTGAFICFWMMIIYSATPENTRRGQFEIFWYSHHCFVLFFIFILFHGKDGINPHYWMYAIPCLSIYVLERILRVYRASLPVSVLSVTIMDDVLSLEFAKEGVFEFEQYKEGQYLFLQSPAISRIQWHPFTISSAPQEHSVTVHIRVMGEGSWTRGLMQYMSTMAPKGKNYCAFDRITPAGKMPGKILGPDGRSIIKIDGPHSAPTQHVGEYSSVMVVGAGIGATPVSSTLKSVVFHRWRLAIGECFPAHAYFMWVCAHRDIDAFRWLLRTIKEAQDEVVHQRVNSPAQMAAKTFEVHIFLTSAPKNPKPVEVVVDDEIGFWGPPREASNIDKIRANWDEIDLYKAMKCPIGHKQLGDVHIWEGRPKWGDRFKAVATKHNEAVGVTFCGNPMIAKDLRKECFITNKTRTEEQGLFKLHKENF